MAYKFQLGKAKLSGSIETAQAITSQGGLTVVGTVALDNNQISNEELVNSTVIFNGVTVALGSSGSFGTDAVTEGSNLYYTDARWDTKMAAADTADLAEGTNLYHTVTRARDAVGADGAGINYNSATGVFSLELTGGSLQADASGLRTNITLTTLAPSGSGGLLYNNADGKLDFKPVEEAWVRQRLSGKDAIKYNSASGSISLQLTGTSLFQNASGLQVEQSWVREQFSEGAGLDYSAGVFSVQTAGITNGMLANPSLSVVAGNGLIDGGSVSLGGSVTLNVSASSENAIIVSADGIDLRDTIAGSRTFSGNVTIAGGLTVTGTTTYINTTNLDVADALVKIASGSATFAANHGLQLGDYAELKTALAVADVGNALSSSLPLVAPSMKAASFYGNLVGSMQLGIEAKSEDAPIAKNITKAMANITLTLPTGPAVGQEHRVKCFVADGSSPAVIVAAQVGGTIEGVSQVVLESYGAAVSLVWDGTMWMVF